MPPAPAEQPVFRLLRRLRAAARASLWVERASVAFWPAIGVAGGFLCAALLGAPQGLPGFVHVLLLAVVAGGLVWLLRRARPGLRWPGADAADRRLEREGGLAHRPLAVLGDRPAVRLATEGGDLWRLHRERALAQVGKLRVGWPGPGLAARDPRALRLLLLLGLTIGVVIAGPDASDRLRRAFTPHFAPAAVIPSLEIRAWIAPPSYTGLPPTLLPEGGAVVVPAGSRVTIGLTGGKGAAPTLMADGAERGFDPIGAESFQVQAALLRDGPLILRRDGAELARWDVTLRPDLAPVVAWTKPPSVLRGRIPRVRLSWKASHAYGIASLAAEFRLRDRPDAAPLTVPLPLTARPREAAGAASPDLTSHPWAGLPVTATLSGRDGAGLVGVGEPASLVLPARKFRHPGAQAIVGVRQMLALAPQDGAQAAITLRGLADRSTLWPDGDPAAATLRDIAAMLDGTPSGAVVDAAQAKLWELALRLEEGSTARTAEALRRAQQELRAALDKSASPALKDKAEIDRRAEALSRAMQRQQQALAEQAKRDPSSAKPISPQDKKAAEDALKQLRDAAQADRMDEARDRMDDLDRMLAEMRKAGRSEAQQKRADGQKKGRQQMSVVQDLVRREAGQIDHAESRLSESSPSSHVEQEVQRGQDRLVQLALRRALGELMQQHGELTGSVPKNLGDADAAMRETAQALADGSDPAASAAALRAVEALQQGGEKMGQQLAQQFGQQTQQSPGDQQGGAEGEGQGDEGQQMAGDGQDGRDQGDGSGEAATADGQGDGEGEGGSTSLDGRQAGNRHRDPFGRATREGVMGTDGGRDTRVPEEMEQARGRAVQDELRRREAQRTRPPQELDYIGRLLKPE